MNIFFFGASKFGLKCLKEVSRMKEFKIVGVVTANSFLRISGKKKPVKNYLHADFISFCKASRFPFYCIKKNMNEISLKRFISRYRPDFCLVVGWYQIIPKEMLDKMSFAGLHASLLPKYRGGAPLVWAIINGEKKTGISFFLFDNKIDNGPIIGQKKVMIKNEDTINTLYKKVEKIGIELLKECLPKVAEGKAKYVPQDEKKATIYPQRRPEDGLINWGWSTKKIKNFIRAQTKPYPGAFTILNDKKITIWDADIVKI
jgi:methionyl-tRNA formyltransferase